MNIYVLDGSGRAECCICHQKIDKGIKNQVVAEGYKTSARCHRDCILNWEKIMMLQKLNGKEEKEIEEITEDIKKNE